MRFFLERGAKTAVTDERPVRELAASLAELGDRQREFEIKEYSIGSLAKIDLVVPVSRRAAVERAL